MSVACYKPRSCKFRIPNGVLSLASHSLSVSIGVFYNSEVGGGGGNDSLSHQVFQYRLYYECSETLTQCSSGNRFLLLHIKRCRKEKSGSSIVYIILYLNKCHDAVKTRRGHR
jgi:hypothetical protein